MSSFAHPEHFSNHFSKKHAEYLLLERDSLIIKKSKGVFLYDIDGNKYVDFYLQNGEIFAEYAPSRLTMFAKNALSYGINTPEHYHKFFYKTYKHWKTICNFDHLAFFPNFLEFTLALVNKINKKQITIACENEYLISLVSLLKPLVEVVLLEDATIPKQPYDIVFFEDDRNGTIEWNSLANYLVQVHSRFLFRHNKKVITFNQDWNHLILAVPFAGRGLCVAASKFLMNYPPSTFEDGIILLEGAKYFHQLIKMDVPVFNHKHIVSYHGYACTEEYLDPVFFQKRGIYLKRNKLFFSPLHTEHDFRRLNKALNEYFN
ncbi:MAG: hypothetical protein ACRCTQ_05600 [Brevinemataceae bacterium]